MKRFAISLIAVLMFTAALSTAPASAWAKPTCAEAAFPLMLGVGY